MKTRADVVEAARAYLGVRWHHQGRSRAGIDCAGLIILVAHDLGLSDFDTIDYPRIPIGGEMQKLCNGHLTRIYDVRPGAVLLMRFVNEPQHLAIATADGTIVHALMQERKVIEHRLDESWADNIVAIYDYPGVA